ncbi:FAD-dependent oxidoreductase [Fodinicola feengrottensis]|uniref:FAD-dependent oxidoreductase n=2 Tax=Fodinicola feengrottensis TaxID=435914 RepID=A0ABN2HW91_9ACTN
MHGETTSVLVVGGSSVGLTAALLLARQGIRTTVIERRDGVSIHPRALGLGLRAAEVLQAAGLTEQLAAVQRPTGAAIGRIDVQRVVGTDFASGANRRSPLSMGEQTAFDTFTPATTGSLSQDRLDLVLLTAAVAEGVTVRFNAELEGLDQDARGVRATVRTSDGPRLIEADYLVAADGANSAARDLAGIPRSGAGKLAAGYVINTLFDADLSELIPANAFGMCGIRNDDVGGILIPIDYPHRWAFHIMNAGIETVDDYPAERCATLVRAAIGVPDLPVEILSTLPWRSSRWLADRYREGRVFLVGDAAHVMPPTGGFGLNTGIPDADNLAWKLALVGRGVAGESLLDTYEAERRVLAEFTQDQVLLRAQHMEIHWDGTKAAERAAVGIAEFPVAQLGFPQVSSAVVDPPCTGLVDGVDPLLNLDGAPGTRVPHVWLEIDGRRVSTVELAGPEFVLFGGPSWRLAAEKVAENLDLGLRSYVQTPAFVAAAGIGDSGAMLVRPDGVVAWRCAGAAADPANVIEKVIDQVCGRS